MIIAVFAGSYFFVDRSTDNILYLDISFTELQKFQAETLPRTAQARLRGKTENREVLLSVNNQTLSAWNGFVISAKDQPYPFNIPVVAIPFQTQVASAYVDLSLQSQYASEVSFDVNRVNIVKNGDAAGTYILTRSPFNSVQGLVHKKSSLFVLRAGLTMIEKWADQEVDFGEPIPSASMLKKFLRKNSSLHLLATLDRIQSKRGVAASLILHGGEALKIDSVIFKENVRSAGPFKQTLAQVFEKESGLLEKYQVYYNLSEGEKN